MLLLTVVDVVIITRSIIIIHGDVLTPQIIPDKVPNIFRCLRWSAHFYQFLQNERRSRARVGALSWGRVGVTVRVRVRVDRRPLERFD